MVRYLLSGYTVILTVQASPNEDPLSLQYVWRLTVPERQSLTRSAKGRGGCPRPAAWQIERACALLKCDAGPKGAGGTDEALADARDVSAGRVGRGRCPAVAEGARGGVGAPGHGAAGPPAGRRGRSAATALAVPHRRRPRAPQTSVTYNRNLIDY